MKLNLFMVISLLSAGSAHAADLYRCDRFNQAETYQVLINLKAGEAIFTGNKASKGLNRLSAFQANATVLEFEPKGGDSIAVEFDKSRLEAIVSTVDIYGNREEIGNGVCQQVESL